MAEKTNEVPLIHGRSTRICEPALNPLDEFRRLVTEPTRRSICVAYVTHREVNYCAKHGKLVTEVRSLLCNKIVESRKMSAMTVV